VKISTCHCEAGEKLIHEKKVTEIQPKLNNQLSTYDCCRYAFALLMWEIGSRHQPYEGATPALIAALVVGEFGEREELVKGFEGCPAGYTRLIEQCWAPSPSSRPSAFNNYCN
jgi:hypothetical protein